MFGEVFSASVIIQTCVARLSQVKIAMVCNIVSVDVSLWMYLKL